MLPNIADHSIYNIKTDVHTLSQREIYATNILLLFYPYRIQDDLMLNNYYWSRYMMTLDNNMISVKGLEVC